MKTYILYLKNHSGDDNFQQDFEMEVAANTKEEALKEIRKQSGHALDEWEDDMLLENMGEI